MLIDLGTSRAEIVSDTGCLQGEQGLNRLPGVTSNSRLRPRCCPFRNDQRRLRCTPVLRLEMSVQGWLQPVRFGRRASARYGTGQSDVNQTNGLP